jgi:quinoprotein glucose dehydrogenase
MYANGSEMAWIVQLVRIDPGMRAGEAIFRMNCVRCHGGGVEGVAAGPALDGLGERMGPDSAARVIRFGRGAMPANPQFSDGQLSELVSFLRDPTSEPATTVEDRERLPYGLSVLGRFLDGRGKPVVQPPWGTLNAIDLNTGETLWRVPLGNDEEIDDPEHPVTGTENYGGPIVTAGGLVFIAATNDEKIRAFHARTGEQLWEADLPAGGYATPATYAVDGKERTTATRL